MSNPMAQHIIQNVLLSCYGESQQLRFLMRPQNRLAQYLIAREILKQYATIEDEIEVRPGGKADLFHAVASDIDEKLENFSQRAINRRIRHLRTNGPDPRLQPGFLRVLFSVHIPVNE